MLDDIRSKASAELSARLRRETIAQHEVLRITRDRDALVRQQDVDRAEAEEFAEAILVWNEVLRRTTMHNLQNVVTMTNEALSAIFSDWDLSVEIEPTIRYDKQVYDWIVKDAGHSRRGIDGTGGSVLSMVALVQRVMFILQTHRAPLLVLDEALKAVSEEYKPLASKFLAALAKMYGLHILLVTHDEALTVEANRHYAARRPEKGREAEGNQMAEVSGQAVQEYFRGVQ